MTLFKSWVQEGRTVSLPQRPKNPSYATACVHKRTKMWLSSDAARHFNCEVPCLPRR